MIAPRPNADLPAPLIERRDASAPVANIARALLRLPALFLIGLIWVYQRTASPALAVLFPTCGCRFTPTCSHYAADAVRTHGAIAGSALALLRLLKCTPLHPGGFDPVPPRRTPRCDRLTRRPSPIAPSL